MLKPATKPDLDALTTLDDKLRFLPSWTIHHANHVRESSDGLKSGETLGDRVIKVDHAGSMVPVCI